MHYARPDVPIYLIDPNPVNAGSRVTQIQKGASEGMKDLIKMLDPGELSDSELDEVSGGIGGGYGAGDPHPGSNIHHPRPITR